MYRNPLLYFVLGILICCFAPASHGKLSKPIIQKAQQELKKKGINPGPVDGIIGPKTKSALRRYQAENGLPITGELDAETQIALGIMTTITPYKGGESGPSKKIREDDTPASTKDRDPAASQSSEGATEHASEKLAKETPVDGGKSKKIGTATQLPAIARDKSIAESADEFRTKGTEIARILMLIMLGLIGLGLGGWIVLTGAGLLIAFIILEFIEWPLAMSVYIGVSAAYCTPIFLATLYKKMNAILVYLVALGMPMFMISKYGLGFSGMIAVCDGVVLMNLVPVAIRRTLTLSTKRKRTYGVRHFSG
jgi:hypothetical protein